MRKEEIKYSDFVKMILKIEFTLKFHVLRNLHHCYSKFTKDME